MSAASDSTATAPGARVALTCPDCHAKPAWVHDQTGWAKCSRCELAWPALERAHRGTAPTGATVSLPAHWRLGPEPIPPVDYRVNVNPSALRVELTARPLWDGRVYAVISTILAGSLLLAVPGPPGELIGAAILASGIVSLVAGWWNTQSACAATFDEGHTRVARVGRPPFELGALRTLRARAHGRDLASLVLETSDARDVVLVERCDRALVESLLREIGRARGLSFDRAGGDLVATVVEPEPPVRVRAEVGVAHEESAREHEVAVDGTIDAPRARTRTP